MTPILCTFGIMVACLGAYIFSIVLVKMNFVDFRNRHAEFKKISEDALLFVHEALNNKENPEEEFSRREKWFKHYFDENYENMCAVYCFSNKDEEDFMSGPLSKKFIEWRRKN